MQSKRLSSGLTKLIRGKKNDLGAVHDGFYRFGVKVRIVPSNCVPREKCVRRTLTGIDDERTNQESLCAPSEPALHGVIQHAG